MDITNIILEQHNEQRRLFGFIQEIGGEDTDALGAVWERLRRLLETHAEAEERFFYPRLLKEGTGAADGGSAKEETSDAIHDHNEIRDAARAVDQHELGSKGWFAAVAKADLANSKHMSEEERQALADFRCNASLDERHELGVRFLAFYSAHPGGVPSIDKDPKDYVERHEAEVSAD